jgi:hypothetical protein
MQTATTPQPRRSAKTAKDCRSPGGEGWLTRTDSINLICFSNELCC